MARCDGWLRRLALHLAQLLQRSRLYGIDDDGRLSSRIGQRLKLLHGRAHSGPASARWRGHGAEIVLRALGALGNRRLGSSEKNCGEEAVEQVLFHGAFTQLSESEEL